MKLDYGIAFKSLNELIELFLDNCTTNIVFSKNLLEVIIVELMSKCDIETFNLISSEDPDIQSLGIQLLFGEYLYTFNVALNLGYYEYECRYYPYLISQFNRVNGLFESRNNDLK